MVEMEGSLSLEPALKPLGIDGKTAGFTADTPEGSTPVSKGIHADSWSISPLGVLEKEDIVLGQSKVHDHGVPPSLASHLG